jgi:hypothetical protein
LALDEDESTASHPQERALGTHWIYEWGRVGAWKLCEKKNLLYLLEINPQFLLELTDFLDLSILCIEI